MDNEEHELTYDGKVEGNLGRILGPGANEKYWQITAEVYDPTIDKTYVTVMETIVIEENAQFANEY